MTVEGITGVEEVFNKLLSERTKSWRNQRYHTRGVEKNEISHLIAWDTERITQKLKTGETKSCEVNSRQDGPG